MNKGLLKIYHPEETLRYTLQNAFAKAAYAQGQYLLDAEFCSDDSLDHVDDDSLQYKFPQIELLIKDIELSGEDLTLQTLELSTEDCYSFIELDIFDDEDSFVTECKISFTKENKDSQEILVCKMEGMMNDFYRLTENEIPFKLKSYCNIAEVQDGDAYEDS